MKIEVKQEHIDGAVRTDACKCPVARALRSNGFPYASVVGTSGHLNNTEGSLVWFPCEVSEFVYRFDNCLPVQPFSFELEVPA